MQVDRLSLLQETLAHWRKLATRLTAGAQHSPRQVLLAQPLRARQLVLSQFRRVQLSTRSGLQQL